MTCLHLVQGRLEAPAEQDSCRGHAAVTVWGCSAQSHQRSRCLCSPLRLL